MKTNIIFLIALLCIISCNDPLIVKEAEEYRKELSKNYPITINSKSIYNEGGNYYIELSGTLTNNSEHFLNELYIYPSISYEKSTGDIGYIDLHPVSILSYGNTLEKGNSISFSKKCRFIDFNSDHFKYNFDKVSLNINLKGSNSTGYVLGSNNTIKGQTWQPAKSVNIKKEWDKNLR